MEHEERHLEQVFKDSIYPNKGSGSNLSYGTQLTLSLDHSYGTRYNWGYIKFSNFDLDISINADGLGTRFTIDSASLKELRQLADLFAKAAEIAEEVQEQQLPLGPVKHLNQG